MALKIHPAIGIARLGNSDEFFVGPQIPRRTPVPTDGNYKENGRIRRQAAEFRIFRDGAGGPEEITPATPGVARIEWTVEVNNRKAAVNNILGGAGPRNPGISIADLVVAPAAHALTAPNLSYLFNDGTFRGVNVPLGEMRTDAAGRLQVLSSRSNSNFVLQGAEVGGYTSGDQLSFDNNRFWFDTTADGPVTARVVFTNGNIEEASPAWVIIAPPDFAPGITSIVTLYDTIRDVLLRKFQLDTSIYDSAQVNPDPQVTDPHFTPGFQPSFTEDIFPILERPQFYKWVFAPAVPRHMSLSNYAVLSLPTGAPGENPGARSAIFNKLRDPTGAVGTMPRLHGDLDGGVFPVSGLTLTRTQYEMMRRWRDGNFINDWIGPPHPATVITPAGLDRAALESCIGGAFYPGIETNRIVVLNSSIYQLNANGNADEIRLKPATNAAGGRPPGYLTCDNALPWQADFLKCSRSGNTGWWPAARPDDVFRSTLGSPAVWANIIGSHKDMVEKWTDLKFVAEANGAFIEQP